MSPKTTSAILALALISACQSLTHAAPDPKLPSHPAPSAQQGAIDINRVPLFTKLNLTDAQKGQIQPIMDAAAKRIGTIRSNSKRTVRQKNQLLEDVHDARSRQIESVLDSKRAKLFHQAMLANNLRRNGIKRS